jgi:hypothetical protein
MFLNLPIARMVWRANAKQTISQSGDYEETKVMNGSYEIIVRSRLSNKAGSPSTTTGEGQPSNISGENIGSEDGSDLIQYKKAGEQGSVVVEEKEFYKQQADGPGVASAICLCRDTFGEVEILLQSKFLRKLLQNYVSTQEFEGVLVKPTCIAIKMPFLPLFHYLDDMKAFVKHDIEATSRDRASFSTLEKLCESKLVAHAWETARDSVENGKVAYSDLWALYKPGEKVVVQGSGKSPQKSIMRLNSIRNEPEFDYYDSPVQNWEKIWTITAIQTSWDGIRFREKLRTMTLPTFLGLKSITELKVIPLHLHPDRAEIGRDATSYGKIWKELCDTGVSKSMRYDGLATPLLLAISPYTGRATRAEQQHVRSFV